MTIRFALCADDFALTEGVSRSILELLALQRLSATSVMTNRPHWRRLAVELGAFAKQADLGVHLNLTCAAPLSAMARLAPSGLLPKLADVVRGAAASVAVRAEIAHEIERQLDAFEDRLGRAPDFLDGHQHVHVLPGVRGAVLRALQRRYPAGSVYLRDPADSARAIRTRGVAVRKALTVSGLALGLRAQAARRGIPVNHGFAGFSPFDPSRDFSADLRHFLIMPGPAHLVMCHPGHVDDELGTLDPVVTARPVEHVALKSFCPPAGFRLSQLKDMILSGPPRDA